MDGPLGVALPGAGGLQFLVPGLVLLHLRPGHDFLGLGGVLQGLLQQPCLGEQPGRQNGQAHHLDQADVLLFDVVVLGMGVEQPQGVLRGGAVVAQHQIQLVVLPPAAGDELCIRDSRNDDQQALGDWWVNEKKLKGGLSHLIQRVNDLGIQFGIWYEPEMISPDSDLYRAHPDWAICAQGRVPSIARKQYVLDMTRQDVRDNIFQQMYDVLSQNNIAYIKWDCNRHITEAASAQLPPERQGEFFHRYVLGVYELMDRITTAFPHILLENCAGGGSRFDAGMLYFSPQIWASDNTDPIERLTIQFGASLCYPPAAMGAHVSANPRTDIHTRAAVALCGTFGYELDPGKLIQEEKEAVKAQVADYHKYYDLTHYGDFYRITSPTEDPYLCDWAFVSPDKSEVLFTRVVMRQPINLYRPLRLPGLDPDKLYTDEETGHVYSGALLMHGGLDLSANDFSSHDGEAVVKHFVAKA